MNDDFLDPSNPLSPLSPVHPLHPLDSSTETRVREPQGIKIDMTVNWLTWVLLGIVILILAGPAIKRLVKRLVKRKLWSYFRKPEQRVRECQSCQQFISCAMARVTECPFLK